MSRLFHNLPPLFDSFKHTDVDKPDCSGPPMDLSNEATNNNPTNKAITIAYTYSVTFEVGSVFSLLCLLEEL